jgi:hypothetical protein
LLIAVTQVPQNAFWWAKLSLLCGLVIAQIALSIRASSTAVLGNFTLVLVVMLVSAWMVRG